MDHALAGVAVGLVHFIMPTTDSWGGVSVRLDEMALDMATHLLADPADEMVEIWQRGDEWGWHRMGQPPDPPIGAQIIFQDRVQNRDSEPTGDPVAIERYASDIVQACRAEVEPAAFDPPSPN